MGMTPQAEDFERLAIRWAGISHEAEGYPDAIAAMTAFPEIYAQGRDRLPQTDADRAFALVCKACDILDGKLLYAPDDDAAARLTHEAGGYLDEAVKLDKACFDADRIRFSLDQGIRDAMVDHLAQRSDEVREACLETAKREGLMATEGTWSASVYLRPYLRWRLNLANEQLNCGRYRQSLEVCEDLLALDARDLVGVRYVAAFDYVKLEDAEGLEALIGRFPDDCNAWFKLARLFMAYKQLRLDDAREALHDIVRTYPGAGRTLTYQDEVSVGVFDHLPFAPGSADELFIAVSEGAVVLDENCGDAISALSDWIAGDSLVKQAKESEDAQWELEHPGEGPRDPRDAKGGR